MQDALLTVHRLRHARDPARPLRPWLAVIADRRAVDPLRHLGRRTRREASLEPFGDTLAAPPADGRDRAGEGRLAAEQPRGALTELPDSQRQALTLNEP